ncbi:GntR family transcriptional regulator [Shouchella clausii]|uniref:GntR family transcriptional regulator n=1 Tax=Shouchella clausii TaxID=79880 RepID=UPI002DB96CC9|nr:GntR family transcriptional regulator [Shouchella clausii]MEB5482259.1 GntR family transcriptional regulator [Shouchella clausii]
MKEFEVERPIPYYEQFYHSIKKMIFTGHFKPGDRIVETQLAKEFNVSKSPIREAIRILEKEGLVIVDEKSRVIVYKPTQKDVEEVYFCRMALESFAVSETTKIALDEDIHELEKLLIRTDQAISSKKEEDCIISLNELFHSTIIDYTKNLRLKKQINDLKSLIYYFRILNFQGDDRANTILEQHYQIFEFIQKRESEKAAKAMITHLELDLAHLIKVLPQT